MNVADADVDECEARIQAKPALSLATFLNRSRQVNGRLLCMHCLQHRRPFDNQVQVEVWCVLLQGWMQALQEYNRRRKLKKCFE